MFGSSAQQQAQQAARAVGRAKQAQQKTSKYFRKKLRQTRRELATEQQKTATMTGLPPKEAAARFAQDFYKTVGDIGTAYSKQLSSYDPNVLGSSSARRFAGMLNASMQDYTNRLNALSQQGSARMYQALAAPISQFSQIATNPAFNNLLDTTYMEYAKNPPTVAVDVEALKNMYTYNV